MFDLQMYAYTLRAWVEQQFGPAAAWELLGAATFCAVWCVRKFFPEVWTWFESLGPSKRTLARAFQALPALIISTGVAALGSGGDPWVAVKGAVVGALLPFAHHVAKRYRGATADHYDKDDPRSSVRVMPSLFFVCLVTLSLMGCAYTSTTHVRERLKERARSGMAECQARAKARYVQFVAQCGESRESACGTKALIQERLRFELECVEGLK